MSRMLTRCGTTPQMDRVAESAAERVVAAVVGVEPALLAVAEHLAGACRLEQGKLELAGGHAAPSPV